MSVESLRDLHALQVVAIQATCDRFAAQLIDQGKRLVALRASFAKATTARDVYMQKCDKLRAQLHHAETSLRCYLNMPGGGPAEGYFLAYPSAPKVSDNPKQAVIEVARRLSRCHTRSERGAAIQDLCAAVKKLDEAHELMPDARACLILIPLVEKYFGKVTWNLSQFEGMHNLVIHVKLEQGEFSRIRHEMCQELRMINDELYMQLGVTKG